MGIYFLLKTVDDCTADTNRDRETNKLNRLHTPPLG